MVRARPAIPPRFEVVRPIGEGGMGAVYEANDVERGVRVALKTVLHRDADALARFKNEFRALQGIHHPNLVALGELVAEAGGDAFFTMELVEGVDLLTWVRGESIPSERSGTATAVDIVRVDTPDTDRDAQVPSHHPGPFIRKAPSRAPRDGGKYDEVRLREAFRQIAKGLTALHEAGKVHRDVKPSNVLVTAEGHVVLLDFGLVLDSGSDHGATETNVVGTPAYMAPEQASPDRVGSEADWYAMGVMLYQCLTGRLPFEGAAMAVLLAKHYQEPPSPRTIAPQVPADLEALCLDLLQFEPGARPPGREVLRRLEARGSNPPRAADPTPQSAPFVGRMRESTELRRALDAVIAEQRPITVVLHGESGVGKSALARRFLDGIRAGDEALILAGRCYEREAVPYKAFDEIVDTLSRRIARLPREEALALLPSRIEALAQLFPSLGRIAVVAQSAAAADVDPLERRRAAFRALRELFRKQAAVQPLILAIDDMQWTDADSVTLLGELLRPPHAPPMLLVVTARGAEGVADPSAPPKIVQSIPGDVRPVHVGRLAREDARELAVQLLARGANLSEEEAVAIATEAGGHPLFIDELVRHAGTMGIVPAGGRRALRLDDALWTRVERLDLGARRVLEVACLLGAPVAQDVVAQAAGLEMREFTRAVSLLRTMNFVRTRGARVSDAIEPFHDRVREALVARVDPDAQRECHARIAAALELHKASDPEVLATHWAGAGEPAKGARYAIVAAEQAAQALAFDRSARLFQRAIDLLPRADPRIRALREQLGDAFANGGECARAAAEYERAAAGASASDALDLRRRAAEQLLRSGQVARGLEATRAVLASVGITMPRTHLGAIVQLLWFRFVLFVRGLDFTPRELKDIPAEDIVRVDVCWSVSCTLNYADVVSGALFHARHLLLALRSGERFRAGRALCIEAAFAGATSVKKLPYVEEVLVRARAASGPAGIDPYSEALAYTAEGLANVFGLRFARAIECLERGVAGFRDRCPGSAWEVTSARFFLFLAQLYANRLDTLNEQHEAALKDAVERGDRYAEVMFRVGTPNRRWLLIGDPVRARRELVLAMQAWPERPFHVMHFHALVAESYIALYEGDAPRAHERVRATRSALRSSLLLEMEGVRLEYAGLRARIALTLAVDPRCQGRAALLREAERATALFRKVPSGVSRMSDLSLTACIRHLRGDKAGALAQLDELARAEDEDSWLAAQCAKWLAARMRGGPDADAIARAAREELASRGLAINVPMVAVQFPGLEQYIEGFASSPGSS